MTFQAHQPIKRRRRWPKVLAAFFLLLIISVVAGAYTVQRAYRQNLQPISSSQRLVPFRVATGASVQQVAQDLEDGGLIRAAWAFEWYIRTNNLRDALLAGVFNIRPSMTVEQIATELTQGKVATDLVTILPGQRLDQIRQSLISRYQFPQADVDEALRPGNYTGHPALVDKPAAASLEGYMYPESFQRTADTSPSSIIQASLDQMQTILTPRLRAAIVRRGLTVHQGVILASMIEKEVSNPTDKPRVAQVFLRRLDMGMRLESDPTAFYGAAIAGAEPSLSHQSVYNTYMIPGLPAGPISNVSANSLEAIANPAAGDFLYFVAGDDGRTHFSRTHAEHRANVERYCTKLCAQ